MNPNILKLEKAVGSCFEKPSLLLALVLVLLPSLVVIAERAMYGVDFAGTAFDTVVLAYIRFFALFLVVLAMGLLLEYKKAKSRILGLFSALSLIQVLQLAFAVISLIAMPLILSPATIDFAINAGKSQNSDMVLAQVQEFVALHPDAVNLAGLTAFTAIGLVMAIFGIYLLYKIIRQFLETGKLATAMLTLIALIIMGALGAIQI